MLYSIPSKKFIARLSALFGAEPVVSAVPSGGDCEPPYTQSDWGGFDVNTDYVWLPRGANVEVQATTASQGEFAVVSSLGIGVGDDSTAVFASQSPDFKESGEYGGKQYSYLSFGVIDQNDGFSSGGYIGAVDGKVDNVTSPVVPGISENC
jgi:hypothetical protein